MCLALPACAHYPHRGCVPIFACCGGAYGCRFCHDEEAPSHGCHKTAEAAGGSVVRDMRCLSCMCVQPAAQACQNCTAAVGEYYCPTCQLWESDPAKLGHLWHCDKCGMCRIAAESPIESMVHCDGCKLCVPRDLPHTCYDMTAQVCSACHEPMHTSRRSIVKLTPCGHMMHVDCHDRWALASHTAQTLGFVACPVCRHSSLTPPVAAFFADEAARHARLLDEAEIVRVVSVWCADCNTQTQTRSSAAPGAPLLCGAAECRSLNVSQKGAATLEFARDLSPREREIVRLTYSLYPRQ